jgi:putative oxidoreductase
MITGYRARGCERPRVVRNAVFFYTNFANPNQTFHFIKNRAMIGGLSQIAAFGAGAFSVDNGRQ